MKLCKNIDCDFETQDSYVYSCNDRTVLEKEMQALDKLGFSAEYVQELSLPFATAGAVRFKNQAQFHPLKFLQGIAQNLKIYEHTNVKELAEYASMRKYAAFTQHGVITADKIIVTTHFPFINKHGSYFMKMHQHRSYVIAYHHASKVDGMYVDEAQKGMSFRNYKDLLLIGGGDHRTGKKGGNWTELEEFAGKYYPHAIEAYRWATQDCMTLDEVPYIGNYSAAPRIYMWQLALINGA